MISEVDRKTEIKKSNFTLKELKKQQQQQTKLKVIRRKKIINIRAEINKIESKK